MGTLLPANTFAGVRQPLFISNGGDIVANTVFLQGQALNAPTPNILTLNGQPIANNIGLSTIMDWSYYPAFSTINGNNNDMTNFNKITTRELSVTTLAPRPEPGIPADEVLVGANLFFAGTTGIRDAEEVDTYQLKTNGIQSQPGFSHVTFDTPISMNADIDLNNFNINGGLGTEITTHAIAATGEPGSSLNIFSPINMGNNDILSTGDITCIGLNSDTFVTRLMDANEITIVSDVGGQPIIRLRNNNGVLISGVGLLPTFTPIIYGNRYPITVVGTSYIIPVPGLTPTGLVQVTYISPTGVAQTITEVTAGPASVRVRLSRNAIVGESITWFVIRLG
jgi:hypothetical protein